MDGLKRTISRDPSPHPWGVNQRPSCLCFPSCGGLCNQCWGLPYTIPCVKSFTPRPAPASPVPSMSFSVASAASSSPLSTPPQTPPHLKLTGLARLHAHAKRPLALRMLDTLPNPVPDVVIEQDEDPAFESASASFYVDADRMKRGATAEDVLNAILAGQLFHFVSSSVLTCPHAPRMKVMEIPITSPLNMARSSDISPLSLFEEGSDRPLYNFPSSNPSNLLIFHDS